METLATLLQRERLLLELLVFKIIELRHLLVAGDARFLGWAAEEVERSVEAVRLAELERASVVQELARTLLPDADADPVADEAAVLARLAETAPEPWAGVFAEHREALVGLAGEVADNLAAARRSADAGTAAVAHLLDRVDDAVGEPEPELVTYGRGRTTTWTPPAPRVHTTL